MSKEIIGTKFRHEQKYLCNDRDIIKLEAAVRSIMKQDRHADEKGEYLIRSVYFDDYGDSCYWDNEDGNDPREKIRIRTYNCDREFIRLECKRKEKGKTLKTSCVIDYETCMQILNTCVVPYRQNCDGLYNKLFLLNKTQGLRPKVLVEYKRAVYTEPLGNVRVTFDKYISSSRDCMQLFETNISKRPIMTAHYHIMEVKYDEFCPDVIFDSLQIGTLRETTFSKYYWCRKLLGR